MATVDLQTPQEPAPLPDYLTTPNATLGDKDATWRYGRAPDYSNTRTVYEQSQWFIFADVEGLSWKTLRTIYLFNRIFAKRQIWNVNCRIAANNLYSQKQNPPSR